ncbi:hypothetical protein [Actinacidiphila reveromycinica]|uniref:ATP-dependent DNA ligase n=1 Tax=Actinacidiphila reveromycinica TaxID=659352 RepID=UPI001F36C67B|nr:hypothetical protein [Streptomyces sp. SN-593]
MEIPVGVALAQPVSVLPRGPGLWYEPKYDGLRMIMFRGEEAVDCQARSGRIITPSWPDLAAAGAALDPGTVLDGEAVVWRDGALDFAAAQARRASSPSRALALSRRLPAQYAVFDVLAHPRYGDVRSRPYSERRRMMLELVEPLGHPIRPVPATDDPDVALHWYESLRAISVEGLVIKRASSAYRGDHRIWQKMRHSEPRDLQVVGYTGTPRRPQALVVELPPGGRLALTQRLSPVLASQAAARLREAPAGVPARTPDGVLYTTARGITVESLAGTTRHQVVTVTRVR